MTIHFHCECGQKLKASNASIGKHFECPVCGTSVIVPEADEAVTGAESGVSEAAVHAGRSKKASRTVEVGTTDASKRNGVATPGAKDPSSSDTAELSTTDTKELTAAGAPAGPETKRTNGSVQTERESPPVDDSYRRIYADAPADGAAHSIEGSSTADTARDLYRLVRKMKRDGKVEEKQKPKKQKKSDEEGVDFGALLSELGRTVLPGVVVIAIACSGAYWLASSVMSASRELPELGDVSGVVTFDGAPLAGATVTFIPIVEDEEAASRISSSVGTSDEAGRYELMYVRDVSGAAVGTHQVVINAPLPTGRERLPRRYNFATQLAFEVKPGNNDAPFELTSK